MYIPATLKKGAMQNNGGAALTVPTMPSSRLRADSDITAMSVQHLKVAVHLEVTSVKYGWGQQLPEGQQR